MAVFVGGFPSLMEVVPEHRRAPFGHRAAEVVVAGDATTDAYIRRAADEAQLAPKASDPEDA
jgi:hypothetical protein